MQPDLVEFVPKTDHFLGRGGRGRGTTTGGGEPRTIQQPHRVFPLEFR